MIRQILTQACMILFTSILNAQADQYFSLLNQDSLLKKLQVKSITFFDTVSADETKTVLKYSYDIKGRLRKVQNCYLDGPDTSCSSITNYYARTRLVKTMSLGNYDDDELDIADTILTTYYYYKDGRLRKTISTRSFSSRIDTSVYTYFSSLGLLIWQKSEFNDNMERFDSFTYFEGGNLILERITSRLENLIDADGHLYDREILQFNYSNNRVSQIINLWRNSESGEEESSPQTWSFFYNDSGLIYKIERERVWKNYHELKKETTQYFLRYEFY